MTPRLKIKPGVKLAGLQPQMCVVLDLVPIIFASRGYDCWLTRADPLGEYLDFDSSTNIPCDTGQEIERSVKSYLGDEFATFWLWPRGRLHVEFKT